MVKEFYSSNVSKIILEINFLKIDLHISYKILNNFNLFIAIIKINN